MYHILGIRGVHFYSKKIGIGQLQIMLFQFVFMYTLEQVISVRKRDNLV